MIVQSSVYSKYNNFFVTHYLKRIVALLDRIFSFRNQNLNESPIDADETSYVNRPQVGTNDQLTEFRDLKSEDCIPSTFSPGSIHDKNIEISGEMSWRPVNGLWKR